MKNKIALGVVGLVLLVGGYYLGHKTVQTTQTASSFGAIGGYPVHVSQNATRMDSDFFVSGNTEHSGTVWNDGAVNVSGTAIFAGPTTLNGTTTISGPVSGGAGNFTSIVDSGALTVSGASALNGGATVSGTFTNTAGPAIFGSGVNVQSFGRLDQFGLTFLGETSGNPVVMGTSTAAPAGVTLYETAGNTATTTVQYGDGGSTHPVVLCAWNGASFTLTHYISNSTSTSVSTSTICN